MCGICGIVNFDPGETVQESLLEQMTGAMMHRGPDDEGYFLGGNVGLGHRRLSIIDLGGGHQPIFNEEGSAVIVFNGEVYNYADLTEELVAQGHDFRTRSDTECILHSYEQHGDRCVDKLRGMFTFAIWDRRQKRLFLARDRLGIKPLYYYRSEKFFAFASEIKALLEIPSVRRELDPESLDLYLSLRYVPGPRTMFKGIYKLEPGHLLTLEDRRVRIQKYWDLPTGRPQECSLQDAVAEFTELLEESVRLRLIAEVPLGVFLSGGLDSSAILAVMSKITGYQRIKTFSVGYQTETAKEEESNEFDYARMAARAFGADHHECRVSATDFRDAIPDLVWHLDEPLADPSCIPLYFIAKLARENITVVLSGEGADEILAGYGIYKRMLMLDGLHRSVGTVGAWIGSRTQNWFSSEPVSNYLRMSGLPLEERYRGVSRAFLPEMKRDLLGDEDIAGSEERLNDYFRPHWQAPASTSALNRMLYVDTKVWLPDDILLKADKMTMANALELRVPFLDHKLVEFASRLPLRYKLRGRTGKVLLREAMRGVLPEPILKRSKKGFPVPTARWLRGPLKELAPDMLLSGNSACRRHMDGRVLKRIVREHENGVVNRHQEIWTLLMFEYWHRMFVEGKGRSSDLGTQQAVGVM